MALILDIPERKSLGEHVYERLKEAIVNGEMEAGSRIIENQIADAMRISRTPVREAIHKLDRTGFLERIPSGGFVVARLTREGIEEVFGIRGDNNGFYVFLVCDSIDVDAGASVKVPEANSAIF